METELSKKKLALVSGVSLIFMFMVYQTFFKNPSGDAHTPPVNSVSVPLTQSADPAKTDNKPKLDGSIEPMESMESMGQLEKEPDIEFNPDIRDIFKVPVKRFEKKKKELQAPVNLPAKPKALTMAEKNKFYNQYRFKGAILVGTRPVAIINNVFLHVGDRIDGYRIVSISEKDVKIDTNRGILKLEMIYDD